MPDYLVKRNGYWQYHRRVPKAYADYIVLDIIKRSGGTALSCSDAELIDAVRECATNDGVFMAPEGAASWVAHRKLIATGFLKNSDRVVLFNTGSGLKYLDVLDARTSKALPAKPTGVEAPRYPRPARLA